jgi:hypothetical protein
MTTRQTITEALISSRNILLSGHINEHVLPTLEAVAAGIDAIEVLFTRKIVKTCVAEAIDQVKTANLISAGMILNLIHNLPLDEVTRQQWDIDYFLSVELMHFLEHYEEVKSARLIVLHVCTQIAAPYSS